MERMQINADWNKLTNDAIESANLYLINAIKNIDNRLGKGYAEKHPELVSAYMNAASREMHGAIIGKCILELRDSLDDLNIDKI